MAESAVMRKIFLGLIALSLASCAAIPSSSDVQVISNAFGEIADDNFRVIVRPPSQDMSQVEIVQGFLTAHADLTANYEIAREYLDPEYADRWQARSVSLVEPTSIVITQIDERLVAVEYLEIGTLSAAGKLSLLDEPSLTSLQFGLNESNGQFRISQAPDFALLSSSDIQRNFSAFSVYFFDLDYQRLVPVIYWLPANDGSVATRLVRALLAGPKDGLELSLRSAVPAGTRLELDTVVPIGGVLTVGLNQTALQAVGENRQAMFAQFARTLNAVASTFQIQVGSTNLEYKQSPYIRSDDFDFYFVNRPQADQAVIAVAQNQLLIGDTAEVENDMLVGAGSVYAASNDLRYFAISNGRIIRLYDRVLRSQISAFASTAITLHFDSQNQLWILNSLGELSVRKSTGELLNVVGLPADSRVQDFSIAPDGNQIVLQIPTSLGSQIRVGYVFDTGGAVQITGLQRVERYFEDVIEVDWNSNSSLMLLARVGGEQVRLYQLGRGELIPRVVSTPIEFQRISVVPGWPLLAETAAGEIWKYLDGQWQRTELVSGARYID